MLAPPVGVCINQAYSGCDIIGRWSPQGGGALRYTMATHFQMAAWSVSVDCKKCRGGQLLGRQKKMGGGGSQLLSKNLKRAGVGNQYWYLSAPPPGFVCGMRYMLYILWGVICEGDGFIIRRDRTGMGGCISWPRLNIIVS